MRWAKIWFEFQVLLLSEEKRFGRIWCEKFNATLHSPACLCHAWVYRTRQNRSRTPVFHPDVLELSKKCSSLSSFASCVDHLIWLRGLLDCLSLKFNCVPLFCINSYRLMIYTAPYARRSSSSRHLQAIRCCERSLRMCTILQRAQKQLQVGVDVGVTMREEADIWSSNELLFRILQPHTTIMIKLDGERQRISIPTRVVNAARSYENIEYILIWHV